AGADYARPQTPVVVPPARPSPPAPPAALPPAPGTPSATRVVTAAVTSVASGPWQVQLGAFGVRGNVDTLWNKVKNRPELSGHKQVIVPAGRLTKLLADGFASRAEAQVACAQLSAGGFACIPVGP